MLKMLKKIAHGLTNPFRSVWTKRAAIVQISKNDIKSRYAGSFFGLFWALLYPLLFLACYAAVYIFIFKVDSGVFTGIHYVIFIFSGLVPFLGFSESFSAGASSVVSNIGLLKNTLFPIEYVPVKTVITSSVTQAMGFLIVLAALVFTGRIGLTTPFFLMIWFFQLLFEIGIAWILSAIMVVVRDLQNVVNILTMMMMLMSPIAYPPGTATGVMAVLLQINPAYYVIVPYQQVFMYGQLPGADVFGKLVLISCLVFIAGYYFFLRMKRIFSDYV